MSNVVYDRYSISEEIINSTTHVIGAYISIVFSTLICQIAIASSNNSLCHILAAIIYGISTTLMFTMSAAYHCIQYIPAKHVLKILDHIAIYFAIAGMNTPICLVILKDNYPVLCYTILIAQWLAVLFGSIFKIFTAGKFKNISTLLYLVLGWATVLAIKPIYCWCNSTQISYLVIGGLLYTIGSIFYSIKTIKYFHCVWHLFVLIASVFHFMFILSII